MATILDTNLLLFFKPVFTFLFVFGVLYAILNRIPLFGKSSNINTVIAFSMSMLFMLTPGVKDILTIATPWFVFLFIFIILLVLVFMMVGVEEKSVVWLFSENWVVWTIAIIAIIGILGFAMSQVYGPVVQGLYGTEETAKEGITFDIGRILFHPRMLGMIFILIIASQAVRLIATKN
ncbi:MAG: hypothetical protein QGF74_00865 [Candidatus Nanoarchaeia archaeon]|jgi:hypothetical protein|nr:hypothetical protein [Candidatus Nanoarchaeia archaeon]|tara:strand:+ start:16566 stop:17099 length:534 start_codon:yes stop_codon:yes gene_type:complete